MWMCNIPHQEILKLLLAERGWFWNYPPPNSIQILWNTQSTIRAPTSVVLLTKHTLCATMCTMCTLWGWWWGWTWNFSFWPPVDLLKPTPVILLVYVQGDAVAVWGGEQGIGYRHVPRFSPSRLRTAPCPANSPSWTSHNPLPNRPLLLLLLWLRMHHARDPHARSPAICSSGGMTGVPPVWASWKAYSSGLQDSQALDRIGLRVSFQNSNGCIRNSSIALLFRHVVQGVVRSQVVITNSVPSSLHPPQPLHGTGMHNWHCKKANSIQIWIQNSFMQCFYQQKSTGVRQTLATTPISRVQENVFCILHL